MLSVVLSPAVDSLFEWHVSLHDTIGVLPGTKHLISRSQIEGVIFFYHGLPYEERLQKQINVNFDLSSISCETEPTTKKYQLLDKQHIYFKHLCYRNAQVAKVRFKKFFFALELKCFKTMLSNLTEKRKCYHFVIWLWNYLSSTIWPLQVFKKFKNWIHFRFKPSEHLRRACRFKPEQQLGWRDEQTLKFEVIFRH